MASIINKKKTYASGQGVKDWFQLNRWGPQIYTFAISFSGTATVDLEITFVQLNRNATISSNDIFTLPSGVGITSNTAINVADMPIEFVRINQVGGTGTVSLHIMQSGLLT